MIRDPLARGEGGSFVPLPVSREAAARAGSGRMAARVGSGGRRSHDGQMRMGGTELGDGELDGRRTDAVTERGGPTEEHTENGLRGGGRKFDLHTVPRSRPSSTITYQYKSPACGA